MAYYEKEWKSLSCRKILKVIAVFFTLAIFSPLEFVLGIIYLSFCFFSFNLLGLRLSVRIMCVKDGRSISY